MGPELQAALVQLRDVCCQGQNVLVYLCPIQFHLCLCNVLLKALQVSRHQDQLLPCITEHLVCVLDQQGDVPCRQQLIALCLCGVQGQ